MHARGNTNIIGNISFIYIFKLIFTSIKLYIFLEEILNLITYDIFSVESNKLTTDLIFYVKAKHYYSHLTIYIFFEEILKLPTSPTD